MGTLAIILMLIPVAYSLWMGWTSYKEIKKPVDFFLHPAGFVAQRLRDSITASNISLGAAIFAFLSFGYSFKIAAVISPITWLAGFLILMILFPKIKVHLGSKTLHGFLSGRFASPGIGYLASAATIVGFLGTYGVEVLVAIKLFRVILPASVPDIAIALILSAIVTFYTALGGFKAASHADKFRLLGTIVGIATVMVFVIYVTFIGGTTPINKVIAAIGTENYGFGALTFLFVLSLFLVNVPWQLVDMSVWQRLVACNSQKDIKKGLLQSIWMIGVLWSALLILGFMMHFIPNFIPPENGDYTTPFLHFISNPIIFAIFAAGCIAALMSTADSLLIASVQTLIMDIIYQHRKPHEVLEGQIADSKEIFAKNLIRSGRRWVWIFGLLSPLIIYFTNLLIAGILDLFFLIYSAQLALLASVIVAIFLKKPERFKWHAITSVSVGLITAAFMFFKMLFNPSMETFLLSPILAIGFSLIPWLGFYIPGRSEITK
jgi:Na+/proline symporter